MNLKVELDFEATELEELSSLLTYWAAGLIKELQRIDEQEDDK